MSNRDEVQAEPVAGMPDAIILCGGAGLRLRSVTGDGPKSMATIAGRPFLDALFRQLEQAGFRRVILAVGYAAGTIESYYGERYGGIEVVYSRETAPLGTGGAIGRAARYVKTSDCVVMNGDSYTDLKLNEFVAAFRRSSAEVMVAVVGVDGREDSGSVLVNNRGHIEKFAEKEQSSEARHLNAGIYATRVEMLRTVSGDIQVSLERELFPQWLREGRRIEAFQHNGSCFDIGTPERYQAAQAILAETVKQATEDGKRQ